MGITLPCAFLHLTIVGMERFKDGKANLMPNCASRRACGFGLVTTLTSYQKTVKKIANHQAPPLKLQQVISGKVFELEGPPMN